MKFKVGQEVKLSAKGVEEFSKNGWSGYSVPYELFRAGAGVVTSVQGANIYVTTDEGVVWFFEYHLEPVEKRTEEVSVEYTGGSSSYYKVRIENPTTFEDAYDAECNDIIEALDMNFAEGNIFKAVWRKAAQRKYGRMKKGYDNGLYDAEKVVFFGQRMIEQVKGGVE